MISVQPCADHVGVATHGQPCIRRGFGARSLPDAPEIATMMEGEGDSYWEVLRRRAEPPDHFGDVVPADARRVFCLAMGEYILSDVHGLWMEPESEDGHNPEKLAIAIGTRTSELHQLFVETGLKSPIEGQLAAALIWMPLDWAGFPLVRREGPDDVPRGSSGNAVDCWLTPQACIGAYKADFLLWFDYHRARGGLVIECDGHEFHERTKDQAARDKKRDREIVAAGYPVLRFTGSEIFRDPVGCAAQVADVATQLLSRVTKEGRPK